MKDKELYAALLGLKKPWSVKEVKLDLKAGEILVSIECGETVWGCPECKRAMHLHGYVKRKWRHLDTCQMKTIIEAEVPRVKCPDHQTEMVQVPWAEGSSRFTDYFERRAILLLQECNIKAATRHLRISWEAADRIKERGVKRGLVRKESKGVVKAQAICVDEKSVGKGHKYLTVVTKVSESGKSYIDYLAEGREEKALDGYWQSMSEEEKKSLRCVSMDMWKPYINSTSRGLENGVERIVHDHFHLIASINRALDSVRRQEMSIAGVSGDLKGTRNMWLYGEENLPPRWRATMDKMKEGKTRTAMAWRLKEMLREFFRCENVTQAKAFFAEWYQEVVTSALTPVLKIADMIKNHLPQVLNFFRFRITNAYSEGCNSKIQTLIQKACGYRNRERLKRDLFFHFGNLDMLPIIPL